MEAKTRDRSLVGYFRSPALGNLLHRGAWGLADQALLSLGTFVTLALIARANTLEEFGLFSLAFAFINLEMAVSASVFSEPFAVISAFYDRSRYSALVSSTYLMHLALGLLVALAIAIFALVDVALGWGHAELIILVAPAMLAWQLQDFTRQPLYVEGRVTAAFLNDVVSYGGQIGSVGLASYFGVLSGSWALGIVALSSGAAVIIGLLQLRRSISTTVSWQEVMEFRKEIWAFGRWVLGGTFLTSVSFYLQPFILAAFRGAPAAGELRAMMTLMGPGRIIIRGMSTAFTPMAAAAVKDEGKRGLDSLVMKIFQLAVPMMGTYCVLVSVRPSALVSFLFGEEYARSASWLLPLVALAFFAQMIVIPWDVGLRALRVTNPVFRAGVQTFVAFWCFGVPAMYFLGLLGAGLVAIGVPTIVGFELWRNYRKQTAAGGVAPAPAT
ncbi:MAG TPA: lipopolysaccharide biosynthesis protein [Terriglobia bacterium]